MNYFKKITGERCYLSPIDSRDSLKFCEWFNDFGIAKTLSVISGQVQEDMQRRILKMLAERGVCIFAILLSDGNKLIGSSELNISSNMNFTAEVGITIGDREYLSKGYGTEAMMLTLDFAFSILNMRNVMLEVFAYNKRAIRSYEKCGFKEIGRRREAKEICGKRHDVVYMDILREEFKSPYFENAFEE